MSFLVVLAHKYGTAGDASGSDRSFLIIFHRLAVAPSQHLPVCWEDEKCVGLDIMHINCVFQASDKVRSASRHAGRHDEHDFGGWHPVNHFTAMMSLENDQ